MLEHSQFNWTTTTLGNLATLRRELVDPQSIKDCERFVGLEHINGEDGSILSVSALAANIKSTKARFCAGDVLYGKLRPYLRKITIPSFDGICSTDILALKVNEKQVDRRYLFHFLRQQKVVSFATDRSAGANLPRLSPAVLLEIPIHMPQLVRDQSAIAEILDTADRIQAKRRQALHVADELLHAIFLDMFGDPFTNPRGWERKAMGGLGLLARGKSKHRPRNDPALLGGPYPLIQTGEVANADTYIRSYSQSYSELGLRQSKLWPKGTLCITIAANIADTAILGFDACFPDSVVGFTPGKEATTEYIHFWLRSYQRILQERAPESAQKNINLEILDGLMVGCPPIEKQNNFVQAFNSVEALKIRLRYGVYNAENLFFSVQQQAFHGGCEKG